MAPLWPELDAWMVPLGVLLGGVAGFLRASVAISGHLMGSVSPGPLLAGQLGGAAGWAGPRRARLLPKLQPQPQDSSERPPAFRTRVCRESESLQSGLWVICSFVEVLRLLKAPVNAFRRTGQR